jgi:hypothetical protein
VKIRDVKKHVTMGDERLPNEALNQKLEAAIGPPTKLREVVAGAAMRIPLQDRTMHMLTVWGDRAPCTRICLLKYNKIYRLRGSRPEHEKRIRDGM